MTEMIERVARAICENAGHINDRHWQHYVPAAQAAIKAMEIPSQEMIEAMVQNIGPLRSMWSAAIRASLAEWIKL